MPEFVDIAISLAYLILAWLIFDRVLPVARRHPAARIIRIWKRQTTARAIKFWNLAVAIGLFAVAGLFGRSWLYDLGHLFLVIYVAQHICPLIHKRPERWGKTA